MAAPAANERIEIALIPGPRGNRFRILFPSAISVRRMWWPAKPLRLQLWLPAARPCGRGHRSESLQFMMWLRVVLNGIVGRTRSRSPSPAARDRRAA